MARINDVCGVWGAVYCLLSTVYCTGARRKRANIAFGLWDAAFCARRHLMCERKHVLCGAVGPGAVYCRTAGAETLSLEHNHRDRVHGPGGR